MWCVCGGVEMDLGPQMNNMVVVVVLRGSLVIW